jgi:hypothetical protein
LTQASQVTEDNLPNPESGCYEPFPDFVDYVMSFYNDEDGVYPIEGLHRKSVVLAVIKYLSNWKTDCPFLQDSEDRIAVSQVLHKHFGYKNPYGSEEKA